MRRQMRFGVILSFWKPQSWRGEYGFLAPPAPEMRPWDFYNFPYSQSARFPAPHHGASYGAVLFFTLTSMRQRPVSADSCHSGALPTSCGSPCIYFTAEPSCRDIGWKARRLPAPIGACAGAHIAARDAARGVLLGTAW
eukprot:gene10153-biopygen7740